MHQNARITWVIIQTCVDPCDGSSIDYICMSCQPFLLKFIKIESEYKKAQNTFQQKQGCAPFTTQSHSDNSQKKVYLKILFRQYPTYLIVLNTRQAS